MKKMLVRLSSILLSKAALAVFIKHIIGGINYALINVIYDSKSDWKPAPENAAEFKKPAFQSFVAFLSCFLCLLPPFVSQYRTLKSEAKSGQDSAVAAYDWKSASLLVLPSVFDYVAVTLSLTSNQWILASLIVVVKGCRVLFSTLLSKKFLGHTYRLYHWAGVLLVFPGVAAYSFGSLEGKSWLKAQKGGQSTTNSFPAYYAALGISMVFLAEGLRASKAVYEEKMLKTNKLCPRFIAVVEGALCTLLSIFTLFIFHIIPGSETAVVGKLPEPGQTGSMENFWNTLEWLSSSRRVQFIECYMILTIGVITFFGFLVTKYLSAVHNALWGELRIVIVYLTEMIIAFAEGKRFFTPFTPLQILGFAFLLLSGFVFNRKLTLPCTALYREDQEQQSNKNDIEDQHTPNEPETVSGV